MGILNDLIGKVNQLTQDVSLLYQRFGRDVSGGGKDEWFWAKITAVDGSGNYSWTKQFFTTAGAFTDHPDGRVGTPTSFPAKENNGITISTFPVYAKLTRRLDLVTTAQVMYGFDASVGSMSAGITVEEQDATPSYANVTKLIFDQADGFVVSQPAAAQARIDLSAASATLVGIVNTSAQTFAGRKTLTRQIAGGTALAAADVAISASWGASATFAVRSGSNDECGVIEVSTNAADTPTAVPTVTVTFKDGTWGTAPFALVGLESNFGISGDVGVQVTTTATQMTFYYFGTPTALTATSYNFCYLVRASA